MKKNLIKVISFVTIFLGIVGMSYVASLTTPEHRCESLQSTGTDGLVTGSTAIKCEDVAVISPFIWIYIGISLLGLIMLILRVIFVAKARNKSS